MPASCELMRPVPNNGREPNGVGKFLTLKSQMKPARLLRMPNSAMNTTMWLRIGASWIGRNNTRSTSTPNTNEIISVTRNATQYGVPSCISCQAMKVENIAISPCAKLRWSIA